MTSGARGAISLVTASGRCHLSLGCRINWEWGADVWLDKSSQDGQAAARVYTYACPSCQQCVQSSVFTGKVNTRGHCGHQFRVAAGRVWTRYTHACPTCNTKVESKQPHGRIRAQHTNARGRTCKTTEWLVAAPNELGRQEK